LTLAILLTSPTSTAAAAAQVQRTELGGVIYVVGVEGLRGLDTNLKLSVFEVQFDVGAAGQPTNHAPE